MTSVSHTMRAACATVGVPIAITLILVLSMSAQLERLTAEETFSTAHLTSAETAVIIAALEGAAYDIPDSWEDELRVRRVNLGDFLGLIPMGSKLLCGATGNCQIWVLRKVGGKWKSLFATEQAPIAEGFQLGPTLSHGIKDLTIVANMSADRANRVVYRFDGKSYQPTHTQR